MANAEIHVIGPNEHELLATLYNQILRPPVEAGFFKRRFEGRRDTMALIADLEKVPVGFLTGYELRPSTYYLWLCGVLPDARRLGVASQLMQAAQVRVAERGYEMMRFECLNQARPMLHVAIRDGFDIVGIRWDARNLTNLVIFEKVLAERR